MLVAFAGGRGLSLSGGDIPAHRRHSAWGNSVKLAGVAGRETEEAPSTALRACCIAIVRSTDRRHSAVFVPARKAFSPPKRKIRARVGRMFIVGVDRCGGRGGPYERAGSEIRPGNTTCENTTWEIRLVFLSPFQVVFSPILFDIICYHIKKATYLQEKYNLCATVAVRAWFGPAPHVRGAHDRAVPAVVRLTP